MSKKNNVNKTQIKCDKMQTLKMNLTCTATHECEPFDTYVYIEFLLKWSLISGVRARVNVALKAWLG